MVVLREEGVERAQVPSVDGVNALPDDVEPRVMRDGAPLGVPRRHRLRYGVVVPENLI